MDAAELLEIVSRGEDGKNQFKANMSNAAALASERSFFCRFGFSILFSIFERGFGETLESQENDLEKLLENMNLMNQNQLNLTVENIKRGNSNIRNPILASFATKIPPYRGLGNGIRRALKIYPDIDFIDDREGNLFTTIIRRK